MGGWNKGKTITDWNSKVNAKFGDSFGLVSVGEPNSKGERLIIVECLKCNSRYEVSSISFRGKYGKSGHCSICLLKRLEVERQIKERADKLENEKQKIGKKLKANQIGLRFCKECNLAIVPTGRTYCDNCILEHHRANARNSWKEREHKRRVRIKGNKYDKGITLEKLYERDQGICYLCGRVCDWKDYKMINEAFVVGGSYPSIEHVMALCNGGSHTWDNVKLACFDCNTSKGRKILNVG